MKKIISLLSVILVLCTVTGLVSCGGGDDELKGAWTRNDENYGKITLEFDGNGNAKWGYVTDNISFEDEGTYTVKDNTVTVSMKLWDEPKLYTFTVSENGLSLTSSNEVLGGALVGDYRVKRY